MLQGTCLPAESVISFSFISRVTTEIEDRASESGLEVRIERAAVLMAVVNVRINSRSYKALLYSLLISY